MALPAVLLLVLLAWAYLPLGEWFAPDLLIPQLSILSDSGWGGPLVVLAFLLGSLVIFPVTVLITVTAITFDPWSAFLWALCGCVVGSAVNFSMGRWLGKRLHAGVAGNKLRVISERFARGGILPVLVIRNLPVAPFAVIGIAAGASSIRLSDFLIGTALGVGPGIAALTLLGGRLRGVWEHPTAINVGFLAGAVVLWIALALGLQILSNRLSQR